MRGEEREVMNEDKKLVDEIGIKFKEKTES